MKQRAPTQHREALALASEHTRWVRDPEVGSIVAAVVTLPEGNITMPRRDFSQHRYPELVAKRAAQAVAVIVLTEVRRRRTTVKAALVAAYRLFEDPASSPTSTNVAACALRRRLHLPTIRPKDTHQ